MKIIQILALSCVVVSSCCWLAAAQNNHNATRKHTTTQPRPLSAQELFKRISPSVFVVESLDGWGRPIEQGSAVVVRVDRFVPDSIAARFSAPLPRQNGPKGKR